MTMNDAMQAQIDELARLITYHQNRYYNDTPEISDDEFDLLWDQLKSLAPNHELFSRVGVDSSDRFEKRKHLMPMNSQDKASSAEQFLKWAARVNHPRYIVQHKLDGASIELQYRQGKFVHGVTRGDGVVGDDITANVMKMRGVPGVLPVLFTGSVRGEVIMDHQTHRERFADKANCRNAANGLMRRKDGVGSEYLTICCYDAFSLDNDVVSFTKEEEKLAWLEHAGFLVVNVQILDTPEAVIQYRDLVTEQRDALGYDIDGLVVKGSLIDPADAQRSRPQKQIAFKFSAEEGVTILRDVEWSESGHLYTPVGILDPVQLAGTTVRRASLVHPELIATLGVRIGSEVVVTKRGDIIPKIERLVRHIDGGADILPPDRCGTCGAEVINEGKRVYCSNPICPRRAFHRLQKWISVLEVRDFGDVLLQKAFDAALIREIADLYGLTVGDLAAFPGVGEVSATKALNNLHSVSEVPLPRFLAGFDLGGIAELKIARMVDAGFNRLDALFQATPEELATADGIAETTAVAFKESLLLVRDQIERLLATGAVRIAPPAPTEGATGEADAPLAGQTVCFTGALTSVTRSDAERMVRAAGGQARSSVSRGLNWLVTNEVDGSSSKLKKARELGVSIITEDDFLTLVDAPRTP